jgi:ribonuclease HII
MPNKLENMLILEKKMWAKGFNSVAGVDESGRGPLAGPVVAACVVLSPDFCLPGIDDCKKLPALKREVLFDQIMENAHAVGIGTVGEKVIDRMNILNASMKAMRMALNNLKEKPQFVLVDGNQKIPHLSLPQLPVIAGDTKSLSIAAASILAKVTRDRIMQEYHLKYPQFHFAQHKGYATRIHVEALRKFGPCEIHRRSFKIVKLCLSNQTDIEMR